MTTLNPVDVEQKIRKLPALPELVMQVIALIDRGEVDLGTISKKIKQDQSLSLKILGVANSSFYGFSGQISAIKDACILLGIPTIRSLVMSIGFINALPGRKDAPLDGRGLWQHAIGVAAGARVIAQSMRVNPELAFSAGLLHDIGKLALETSFPKEYLAVTQYRDQNACLLRDAETAVLGMDHAIVGGMLAQHWHLPDAICNAIQRHHSTDLLPSNSMADIVHVADILSRALDIGDSGDDWIPKLSGASLQRTQLDLAKIKVMLPDIEAVYASTTVLIH